MTAARLLLVAAVLLLSACELRRPDPVPAQCDAMCFAPCVAEDGSTGLQLQTPATDPEAWDELGRDLVPELAERLRTCEVRRKACEQCLRRLDKHGAIQL